MKRRAPKGLRCLHLSSLGLSFLGGLAALHLLLSTPAAAQPAGNPLPPGEGRDLLASACTPCHGLNTIMAMRDGAAGWKPLVYNMVLRGAQLSAPEIDAVIQYLAANFGPGSPRPPATQVPPIALPDGAGRELIEVRCALCHDLGRVVAVKRRKSEWDAIVANMINRGATATPDEARTISTYLVAQFGSN
jgi:cytochrome c5